MPYISQTARKYMDKPDTAGEVNYKITRIVDEYLERKGLMYQHINDMIGALEGAKLELYRRVAAPYEDQKMKENGEVYTNV
jgi:hypothetical protein